MQPPSRPPSSAGRGRRPARWTVWEISLILVSALMIAFPLYAEVATVTVDTDDRTPEDVAADVVAALGLEAPR